MCESGKFFKISYLKYKLCGGIWTLCKRMISTGETSKALINFRYLLPNMGNIRQLLPKDDFD